MDMQLVECSQKEADTYQGGGGGVNDTDTDILLPFVTSQLGGFKNLVMYPMPSEKQSEQKKSRLRWQDRGVLYSSRVEQNRCAALCSSASLSQPLLHAVGALFSAKAAGCIACSLDWDLGSFWLNSSVIGLF